VPSNVMVPTGVTCDVTGKATAAITGKRMVGISGNRTGGPALSTDQANEYQFAHAGAGTKAFGIAEYDAAINTDVGVIGTPGRRVVGTAGAAIAAGVELEVGTAGKLITLATGKAVGLALSAAAGDLSDVEFKLY
jgi:hypothetical protein